MFRKICLAAALPLIATFHQCMPATLSMATAQREISADPVWSR